MPVRRRPPRSSVVSKNSASTTRDSRRLRWPWAPHSSPREGSTSSPSQQKDLRAGRDRHNDAGGLGAARTVRPRSPSLEEWRDEPFSPEAVAWRPGSSWTVGLSPWFVTAAAGLFLVERCILLSRMTVGAALSSAKCTFQRRAASGEAGVAACGPCSLAGVPVVVVDRPVAPLPGARGGAGCPNLPQRPGSSRNARRESLIFRGFVRGRYRRGAPLWQILTRPRPGPSQEPHQHHHMPAHPLHSADPAPEAAGSGEIRLNEPFSPGGPLDWRGSARWCGKDWAGGGGVRAGTGPG